MDRETFISILTDGYQFQNLSEEQIRMIPEVLIQLINESEHEIWASMIQDATNHNSEQEDDIFEKVLIEIDSYSLLYIHFLNDKMMFFLYDEDSVKFQLQRIARGIGFIMECVQWLVDSLHQNNAAIISENKEEDIKQKNKNKIPTQVGLYDKRHRSYETNVLHSDTLFRRKFEMFSKKTPYKKWKQQSFYTQNSKKIYQIKSTTLNQHHLHILDSFLAKNDIFQKLRIYSEQEDS